MTERFKSEALVTLVHFFNFLLTANKHNHWAQIRPAGYVASSEVQLAAIDWQKSKTIGKRKLN